METKVKGRKGAYIPMGLVGLFAVLVWLIKEDKQAVRQIEVYAKQRAKQVGWQEPDRKV